MTKVYDARGRVIRTIDPLGDVTAQYYDNAGRVIAVVSPLHFDETKALSEMTRTEYLYDALSRVVTVTQIYFDDRDATWKSFVEKAVAYDSMNNVTKQLDAMGYIAGTGETIAERIATGYGMTYTYNLAGMRVTELDPESAALGLTWSMRYTYDALGRLTFTENIEGTLAHTECGIVCATDIMAILAQQPGYASLFSSVSSNYSVDEYFQNMEIMSNYVVPIRTYLDFSISTPFGSVNFEYYPQGIKIPIINKDYNGTVGVFPQSRFYKGVQTYAQERNVDLYAHSLTAADGEDFNVQNVKKEIATALTQGCPVALQVGLMADVDWMRENPTQTGIFTKRGTSTSAHYVTVVGMQIDEDGQTILKVLTWGGERYIDLDNFVQSACQMPTIIGEIELKSHGIVWFGPESEKGLFFQR